MLSRSACDGVTVRTRDRALAEDVAAEAFERLLVTLRSGEDPTDRRAWLRRVALNLVIGRMGSFVPLAPRADPTLDEIVERERWAAVLAMLETHVTSGASAS